MKQLIPPFLVVACLGLMILLRWLWPGFIFLRPPYAWVGVLPFLAGLASMVAGGQRFHKAHTTVKPFHQPRRLVTDGIFRYTRNPMYLGDTLMLLGVGLFLGAASAVLPLAAFWLIIDRWVIPAEETILTNAFGQEFRDYCARTRRWI